MLLTSGPFRTRCVESPPRLAQECRVHARGAGGHIPIVIAPAEGALQSDGDRRGVQLASCLELDEQSPVAGFREFRRYIEFRTSLIAVQWRQISKGESLCMDCSDMDIGALVALHVGSLLVASGNVHRELSRPAGCSSEERRVGKEGV